jgi:regulator of sigma E protease
MHEFLVSTVAFIVLVGVMVVVHEFGHFAVAKLCGVRVEAFSIGFGPRLFGVTYGDTDYKVCLLPLGGYVKMTGETPDQISSSMPGTPVIDQLLEKNPGQDSYSQVPADDPGAFTAHPRWQRMLIGVAGPVANFILALGLMTFYFSAFNEVPSYEITAAAIDWVVPGSMAAQAGIQTGDVIQRFGTVNNPDWDAVNRVTAVNQGQTVPVTVDRGGKMLQLAIHLPAAIKGEDFSLMDAGYIPQFVRGPIGVLQVEPGMPAARAGLRDGDAIQSVDGHSFHTVQALLAYMENGKGNPISLAVRRNGVTLPPIVANPTKIDTDWKLGFAPLPIPFRREPLPLNQAVAKSGAFCVDNSTLIVQVLGRILTHKVSISQLSGPLGIARMAGDAAETRGWYPKLGLASAISLNLGIINLMPFPILDGGLILLLLIESVLRHDINFRVKERIYQAAFVLLLVFFAFIIANDVTRLPIFAHLKP